MWHNPASLVRLNNIGPKCAWVVGGGDRNPWVQVNLSFITMVTGVATQGRCDTKLSQWVTSYIVSHSLDSDYWQFYKDSQFDSEKVSL